METAKRLEREGMAGVEIFRQKALVFLPGKQQVHTFHEN
jgi:hypothetical protein